METSNAFQKAIKNYLEERRKSDGNLAEAMLHENKNIQQCCQYILTKVKEKKVFAMTNEEVFEIAVKYYLTKEELKISNVNCKVVVTDLDSTAPLSIKKNTDSKTTTTQMSIFDLM